MAIWHFRYKKGPAPMEGFVEASGAVKAYEVAAKWCRDNRKTGPLGDVRPMVCADESILGRPELAAEAALPATAVGAVTHERVMGSLSERAAAK